jgi:ankyrin repeat protein
MNSFQTKLTVKTIKTDLRDLPKGLAAYDTAYDDTMARIFGQEMDFQESAKRILSLVLYAKRPLQTCELQHALMVEPHTTELDQDGNLEVEDILSVCAGLITTDTETDTIRFVHYTTQEYLQRKRGQWLPRGEFEIARACLDYLLMEVADFDRRGSTEDMTSENNLAEYAIHYGPSHWDAVVQVEKSLHNGLLKLFHGFRHLSVVGRKLSRISCFNQLLKSTPVYWFAELGLLNLTRFCIYNNLAHDDGGRSDTRGDLILHSLFLFICGIEGIRSKDCGTPLLCAAGNGHVSVVQLLLEHNAAIDSRNDRGQTPLAVAAIDGHESVVCLLLQHNASVNSSDNKGRTALAHAAENGHEPTVRILLDNAADIEIRNDLGDNPLSMAAKKGHETVVQLLLERGAAVDVRNNISQTPLMVTASLGGVSVMSLLLAHNADTELRDEWHWTPLLHGVTGGFEMAVDRLPRYADAMDAEDEVGETPFFLVRAGHGGLARSLFEHHTVVDNEGDLGRTTFLRPTRKGQESVVRLLLENGAAIDTEDKSGRTALSYAADAGYEGMVRLLLEHHAVVDSKDHRGRTPLSHAIVKGHESVVRLLLENNAAIDIAAVSADSSVVC